MGTGRDPAQFRLSAESSDLHGFRGPCGYCYAKSHLLAAILRANGIPAGFCYQRLSRDDDGAPYCLHGLNAVHLPGSGWYRIDARGNKEGVNARFAPPVECLAFAVRLEGEADLPEIWPDPLPVVVDALQSCGSYEQVWERLPDIQLVRPASGSAGQGGK